MLWREDDDLRLLRESAAAFLDDHYGFDRVRRVKASGAGIDPEAWADMAGLGWFGAGLPEAQGGLGLGLRGCTQLAFELGRHLVPDPFIASIAMPSSVLAATSSKAGAALAEGLVSGARIATLAWQERPAEVGPVRPATTLTSDGAGWRLDGAKIAVQTARALTDILVVAEAAGAPAIVLVEAGAAGIRRQDRLMADGSLSSTIAFDGVPIAAGGVIATGDQAASAALQALEFGRVALCAYLEGAAREAFEVTRRYVGQRVQFGQPIASFQVIRHRLVDLDAALLLTGASWREALRRIEQGEDAARIAASVSAAKARAADTALLAAREGIQMHGAFGYTREADISLFLDVALRGGSWLGTADALRRHAAASPAGWSAAYA